MRMLILGASGLVLTACSMGGTHYSSPHGGSSYGHQLETNSCYAPDPCGAGYGSTDGFSSGSTYTAPKPYSPPAYTPPIQSQPQSTHCYSNPCGTSARSYSTVSSSYSAGSSSACYTDPCGASRPQSHAYGTHAGGYGMGHRGFQRRGAFGYTYGSLGAVLYDVDSSMVGVQGRFGYQWTPTFGAEVEGSLGLIDDSVTDTLAGTTTTTDVDYSVGAFGVARVPVTGRLTGLARLGYHITDVATEVDDGLTVTETSNSVDGLAYGVGVEYALNRRDAIRADYTRYDGTGLDADALSIAYLRRF